MMSFDQRKQHVRKQINIGHYLKIIVPPGPKSETQEEYNRRVLLARVESNWIKIYLGNFLAGQVEMTLRLKKWPHAVENPWFEDVQEFGTLAADSLLTDDHILQIYDEADGKLLILGEPGSGKTILLLKLLLQLLPRASQDESHPIPVVFLLSSWSVRKQALEDWLIQELNTKYDIPRQMASTWVANHAIFPLLDGLDEVGEHDRPACIKAINTYQDAHKTPLVVCCRRADYERVLTNSQHKLRLKQAVCIQHLTYQEIDHVLNNESLHLDNLRAAIQSDPEMQELATSPFMLTILTKVARETQLSEVLSSGSLDARRQQIFALYVESVFTRRKKGTLYTKAQTLYWLAWLAQQLLQFHQAAFYIERMQFDWLPGKQAHRLTRTTVLLFKLLIGAGTGLAGLFLFGLPGGLIFGLVGIIYLAKADLVNGEIEPAEKVSWSWTGVKQKLANSLLSGFGIGLFVILLTLLLSLVSVLFFIVLHTDAIFGLDTTLSSLLTSGAMIMLGSGLLLVIQSGWTSERLDEKLLIRPNQGIWRSGHYSLLVGLIYGGIGGLTFSFLTNPVDGLVCGGLLGLAIGLLNGGMACIKHALLRQSLRRIGVIPWNYSRFLDYGTERMLLHKMGGGYLFIHRLLLEYFATLHPVSMSSSKENPI